MAKSERNGNRQRRESRPKRRPDLGYYFIVTDTKETEKNYLYGLHDALPEQYKDRIVIKVEKVLTKEMVNYCIEQKDLNPQYRDPWIVFDRDRVPDFDSIIAEAHAHNINVGWSNPCIETWFSAYFRSLLPAQDSVKCCKDFAKLFQEKTGHDYAKSDKTIYDLLNEYGDEEKAIDRADNRLNEHKNNGKTKPSEMCPCTTLQNLVSEIRGKTIKKGQ